MSPFTIESNVSDAAKTWYLESSASKVLKSITHDFVEIGETIEEGTEHPLWFWKVNDLSAINALKRMRLTAINEEAGFSLSTVRSVEGEEEREHRWQKIDEILPTVQDVLNARFGDPNQYREEGMTLTEAQKLWEANPQSLNKVNLELVYDATEDEKPSSNIVRVDYNRAESALIVEFKGPSLYKYLDVPPHVADELKKAKSKGRFLAAFVKGTYAYERFG